MLRHPDSSTPGIFSCVLVLAHLGLGTLGLNVFWMAQRLKTMRFHSLEAPGLQLHVLSRVLVAPTAPRLEFYAFPGLPAETL